MECAAGACGGGREGVSCGRWLHAGDVALPWLTCCSAATATTQAAASAGEAPPAAASNPHTVSPWLQPCNPEPLTGTCSAEETFEHTTQTAVLCQHPASPCSLLHAGPQSC
jgi:hypothetical protein